MRKLVYVLIVVSLFFVPLERVQIERLLPVKAVAVYRNDDAFRIELDNGQMGSGASVKDAIDGLKRGSTSLVYLKTTEYLFVASEISDIEDFKDQFKSTVKIYRINASGRVAELADYLDAHGKNTDLHDMETK